MGKLLADAAVDEVILNHFGSDPSVLDNGTQEEKERVGIAIYKALGKGTYPDDRSSIPTDCYGRLAEMMRALG